eukprot:SAG31_NODE_6426_length_2025_cov_0.934579_3_plen_121_part_00
MKHPATKGILGFDVTDIEEAKRRRKAVVCNRLNGTNGSAEQAAAAVLAPAAATAEDSATPVLSDTNPYKAICEKIETLQLVKMIHDFNDQTYPADGDEGHHWREGDDLDVVIGDVVRITG